MEEIIAIIVFLLILLLVIRFIYKRYKARKRLSVMSANEKTAFLNKELKPWGFAYDFSKRTFYSLTDSWQRSFGYGRIYDEAAPFFNMIIDCEPIYFVYDNKKWLVELWKGQYGIMTGAEIGIYCKEGTDIPEPGHFDTDIYESVSDKEMIDISFVLKKQDKTVLYAHKMHWWLTGFRLAQFSQPSDLTLYARLTFHTCEMRDAFISALFSIGYTPDDLDMVNRTVTFSVETPKQPQTISRTAFRTKRKQLQNRFNIRLFRVFTAPYINPADQILYLRFSFPLLFRFLFALSKFKKRYTKKKKYKAG